MIKAWANYLRQVVFPSPSHVLQIRGFLERTITVYLLVGCTRSSKVVLNYDGFPNRNFFNR